MENLKFYWNLIIFVWLLPANIFAQPVDREISSEELKSYIAAPPAGLGTVGATFYKGIKYGLTEENTFDLLSPKSGKPSALVIYIHGGGFVNGDKSQGFQKSNGADNINGYLDRNIAYASIDYRLLKPGNTAGVLQCLNDSKRALQYIRHNAKKLNIDKKNIVLIGGSAGAGTCLWIALSNDMADGKSPDPVLRESTRVKGAVLTNPQATYDLASWNDKVFKEFQTKGFGREELQNVVKKSVISNFYGFGDKDSFDFTAPEVKAYGKKIDMLAFMSADDPEIYVETGGIPYEIPKTPVELNHHPLHAKTLMDEAARKNYKAEFNIPQMNINTTNGESKPGFVFRITGH